MLFLYSKSWKRVIRDLQVKYLEFWKCWYLCQVGLRSRSEDGIKWTRMLWFLFVQWSSGCLFEHRRSDWICRGKSEFWHFVVCDVGSSSPPLRNNFPLKKVDFADIHRGVVNHYCLCLIPFFFCLTVEVRYKQGACQILLPGLAGTILQVLLLWGLFSSSFCFCFLNSSSGQTGITAVSYL